MVSRTSTSTLPLAALIPTMELLRRHARERRHRTLIGSSCYDDTLRRHYTASETSLTLLLEHVLGPLLDRHGSDLINATEQLQLAVRVLSALVDAVTPEDQAVPRLTLIPGGRCLLPPSQTAVLVQVSLAVLQRALLDEALFLVVSLPRQVGELVLVEIEADTPGVAGESAEARGFRTQLAGCLAPLGGELDARLRPEGSLVTIALPLAQVMQEAT